MSRAYTSVPLYIALSENLKSFFGFTWTMLSLTGVIVASTLPYAGLIWFIWMISSLFEAMRDHSLKPLIEFFRKNYDMFHKIITALINIIMKIADMFTPT